VQAYFGANGPAGAAKFAGDAFALATTIDQSLAAGKTDDAKTAATNLQQLCTTCHGQFRERQDDGSYRIKSGG
jgi:cytochrome c556